MLYDKSREQLRKKEEQQRTEAEERQRTELAMRNLELEMRALVNNMKQVSRSSRRASFSFHAPSRIHNHCSGSIVTRSHRHAGSLS